MILLVYLYSQIKIKMNKIINFLIVFTTLYSCGVVTSGADGKKGADGLSGNDDANGALWKDISIGSSSKTTQETSFFLDSTIVRKHLYTLASDEMEGRKSGTSGIEKAAKYIENEFKRIGLTTFEGLDSYRQTFNFTPRGGKEEITSANIIGVLEGTTRKDEYVIISAHYDHLGIKKSGKDKIYNGANDDASGVTGVLILAEYFK